MSEQIPLHRPPLSADDLEALRAVLDRGAVGGTAVGALEDAIATHLHRPHAIAVGAIDVAIEMTLAALDVRGGDEVVVPAFGSVSAAAAIMRRGARPRFVDIDPRTLCARASAIEAATNGRTRAIIGVSTFGNAAGADELSALARKLEMPYVEVIQSGLGARLREEPAGRFGRVAVIGLGGSSALDCGGGAAIVTHDDRVEQTLRGLRGDPGPHGGAHGTGNEIAPPWTAPLDEWRAALALEQLKRLAPTLEKLERIASLYVRRLGGCCDLSLPTVPDGARMGWPAFCVRLDDRLVSTDRDEVARGLSRHDIGVRCDFPATPILPAFAHAFGHRPGDFPVAERAAERLLGLPFHVDLTDREVDLVAQTLELMINRVTFSRD